MSIMLLKYTFKMVNFTKVPLRLIQSVRMRIDPCVSSSRFDFDSCVGFTFGAAFLHKPFPSFCERLLQCVHMELYIFFNLQG
jgi:hypothetical protein